MAARLEFRIIDNEEIRLTHLSESKLPPDTDPWPFVEWYIVPGLRCPVFPAFRAIGPHVRELGGGRRVQVSAALHVECRVDNYSVFGDTCHDSQSMRRHFVKQRFVLPTDCKPSDPPPVDNVVSRSDVRNCEYVSL